MAKKKHLPTTPGDDTEVMLDTAAMPPPEQLALVLRFLRADLANEAAARDWAWALRGLRPRPCASPSGQLKIRWGMTPRPPSVVSPTALREIQARLGRDIRFSLRDLAAVLPGRRQGWALPTPAGVAMGPDESGGFAWTYFQRLEDAIVLAVAQLVAEHADRIRACKLPGCGALFIATKRQEHCTPEHGQQARDERKAERKKGAE